jgi:ABC-type multidrug transport system permease subunit
MLYFIHKFMPVESYSHPWNEADLVIVYVLLVFCWIVFASILLRIFDTIFIKDIGL